MLNIYQVDAFADQLFKGNPAAVVLLEQWLPDSIMQNIAMENNLSETSFAMKIDEQNYAIRWFSPRTEVQFCGYGTLATSFIIFKLFPDLNQITFHVLGLGEFYLRRMPEQFIAMDLPMQIPERISNIPDALKLALNQDITEVYINPQAYIVVYPSVASVLAEQPDFSMIKSLGGRRVAITALNDGRVESLKAYDLISRYFTPSMGIDEDPVTGSVHTSLIPLWYEKTGKTDFIAYQASKRGGVLYCQRLDHNRIEIAGKCQLYLQGQIQLN
ncbi:PhzF family phenazine biosynthesis protein [Acinetobacter calcoaceticus]|uniref:PhzF family phenazine biosynthesis protein n=1 Tax=Acinetobacter calcoaceticus TaxID=471 RepID=A0A4R1Y1Q1_ACICA|nr:PhzF family phenazine biosynthesis protein [Acinetobacter calcoaceticus]